MATKMQRMRKSYRYANGETGRSAKADWTHLVFEILGVPTKDENDKNVYPVVDTVEIPRGEIVAETQACAMGHGIMQKVGDTIADVVRVAAKDGVTEDPKTGFASLILETISDQIDNIKAGVWIEEREGSGSQSVTLLFEAVVAAFSKAGTELTDEQSAGIREKLKDEEYRKKAKARADVAAEFARLQAERAAERAKTAAKKAKDADTGDLADLMA